MSEHLRVPVVDPPHAWPATLLQDIPPPAHAPLPALPVQSHEADRLDTLARKLGGFET